MYPSPALCRVRPAVAGSSAARISLQARDIFDELRPEPPKCFIRLLGPHGRLGTLVMGARARSGRSSQPRCRDLDFLRERKLRRFRSFARAHRADPHLLKRSRRDRQHLALARDPKDLEEVDRRAWNALCHRPHAARVVALHRARDKGMRRGLRRDCPRCGPASRRSDRAREALDGSGARSCRWSFDSERGRRRTAGGARARAAQEDGRSVPSRSHLRTVDRPRAAKRQRSVPSAVHGAPAGVQGPAPLSGRGANSEREGLEYRGRRLWGRRARPERAAPSGRGGRGRRPLAHRYRNRSGPGAFSRHGAVAYGGQSIGRGRGCPGIRIACCCDSGRRTGRANRRSANGPARASRRCDRAGRCARGAVAASGTVPLDMREHPAHPR